MREGLKEHIIFGLKGAGMGAANVIPGVSGGTIALITEIFERLINSVKSFDLAALKLIFTGKLKEFFKKTDFWFLASVLLGAVISVFSLAKLLEYLFENFPVYVWSFFFGLILASVYFVGRRIEKWNVSVIITFLIGGALAVFITLMKPADQNDSFVYLMLCGVVAICSMILPGLSGSFVLILMGNYQLVMIDAVSNLNLKVLIPVGIGAVGGLIAFSHLLSWVFKKFRDQTISILTGFILGSLGIIWPWKTEITETFGEKVKVVGYDWNLPEINGAFFIAFVIMVVGYIAIWLMEKSAAKKSVE
jgi:putative membrane protein